MDDVALERRLTLIEAGQTNAAALVTLNHAAVLVAIGKVEGKVDHQESRIGKLEIWRSQVSALYGAILFAAPFVFYGLTRLFGT